MTFSTAGRPLVFAHRGGCALGPENTLAAFDLGLEAGADGLELDVHLSGDGIVVICHDDTLDRTTGATGLLRGRSASELAGVDAGFHFADSAGAFPFRGRGIGVPTLEEVLGTFTHSRVIVEMKTGEPALARAVAALVDRTHAMERVCVGSFYRTGLEVIRAIAPAIATSASENEARWTLYRSWCRWPLTASRRYCAFQVPERAGRLQVISPAFLRQAHGDGARVDVWVVDDPADMRRMFGWGIDGVITDRPDIAVPLRDEWMARIHRDHAD
jgi:glycerophosphoryl diester phosphodiesterase